MTMITAILMGNNNEECSNDEDNGTTQLRD